MNTQRQKEKNWIIREKYNGQENSELPVDLKRLEAGEPVAYVIGYVDFLGTKIDLSFKPLIPRPETEHWTEQAIELIKKDKNKYPVCLDIFSGSGCIGIAILKHVPGARVIFAEKSSKFCRQIEKNLELNGIAKDRYLIIRANIFRPYDKNGFAEKFDYILANPPYIPEERKNKLDKSVIDWEPQEALFAKDGGLLVVKRFLSEVKEHLTSDGQVYLEFDISQNLIIQKLLIEGKFSDVVFHKDQYSRWRYVSFKS